MNRYREATLLGIRLLMLFIAGFIIGAVLSKFAIWLATGQL
jgi:hypothetical protein